MANLCLSTGERSPRSFQRYNKNAKYEQELLRDEERRLFNRVKRVARKRSGADVLVTSRDYGDVSSTDEPTDLTMTSQLLNDGDRRGVDDGDVNAAMTSYDQEELRYPYDDPCDGPLESERAAAAVTSKTAVHKIQLKLSRGRRGWKRKTFVQKPESFGTCVKVTMFRYYMTKRA